MNSMLKKFLTLLVGNTNDPFAFSVPSFPKTTLSRSFSKYSRTPHILTERELISQESKIGARLFGPIPAGHRREFFCLDDTNWIWHEAWKDQNGADKETTVRYEINQHGILKVQEGARYSYLEGQELTNFVEAVKAYHEQVIRTIYSQLPQTA